MIDAKAVLEVFLTFLRLGVTSFGGPIAHLGYFRREFVDKRGWLSAPDYAGLLALCQFLPGPSSSQVGFSIGLRHAGLPGGLAAWLGFTMPTAIIMIIIAHEAALLQAYPLTHGILHGLQLAAVVIVAQAVWGMAKSLCPDTPRRVLAFLTLGVALIEPGSGGQILVLLIGAVVGRYLTLSAGYQETIPARKGVGRQAGVICIVIFIALLLLAMFGAGGGVLALWDAFYRAGSLVFGGGHVLLPLLRDTMVSSGWVSEATFLTGYGAVQAMPGPLFTVSAYLGAVSSVGPGGVSGAFIALVAIFLPGSLLVAGAAPFWASIQARPAAAGIMAGVNAAVVGLLTSAWVSLIQLGALNNLFDVPVVAVGIALLIWRKLPAIAVVGFCAVCGAVQL